MSDLKNTAGAVQPQGIAEDPLLWATKLFVRFLQIVFSTFEKGSYKWEADFETTDIVIGDQGQLRPEVWDKRPAIVCMRGPAAWSNIAMDQMKSFDFETGRRGHTDLVASSMVYNCVSREGLEAQRLAWIAGYATRALKRNLLRAGLHRVGENVDYGTEQDGSGLADSLKDYIYVPVSVPFFFQDSYSIAPVDNLLLKEMDLRLTSQVIGPTQDGSPGGLRPPAMRGRVLQAGKVISLTQRVSTSAAGSPKPRK